MKSPKNLMGVPKRASGKDMGYQKNQSLVVSNKDLAPTPGLKRVKTDGRIGSVTPPSMLKGGFTVDNDTGVQPKSGGALGAVAARHMSPNHDGQGTHFSPRVLKARAQVKPAAGKTGFRNPVNVHPPALRKVVPK